MKTQRKADIVVGCGVALFGIFIIYASTLITGGAEHRLPPETFPMVVGFLLLLCGMLIARRVGMGWIDTPRGQLLRIAARDASVMAAGCFVAMVAVFAIHVTGSGTLTVRYWYRSRSPCARS